MRTKGAVHSAATIQPALSPARLALAEKIAELAEESARYEALMAPQRRFDDLVHAAASAQKALDAARAADEARLSDWLADPVGPKPQADGELLDAEARAAELDRDARAARIGQARFLERIRRAAGAVRSAALDRNSAAIAVVYEEARRVAAEFRTRLQAAVEVEAHLAAIAEELIVAANAGGHSAAMTVVEAIANMRREAREAAAAIGDRAAARRFLDAVKDDPAAVYPHA